MQIIDWYMNCYFGMQLWQHHFEVFKSLTTLLNIVPIIWNPRKSLSPLYKSSSQLLGTIPGFKGYHDRKIGKTNNRKEKHLFKFFWIKSFILLKNPIGFRSYLWMRRKIENLIKGTRKIRAKKNYVLLWKKTSRKVTGCGGQMV